MAVKNTPLLSEYDPNNREWGFEDGDAGTPLGGVSAPSMPGLAPTDVWYGNPMSAYDDMKSAFARETERRYGAGSNPRGGVFDPRGSRALVPENPADYLEGENVGMDPWAVQKDFDAEANDVLNGGSPVPFYGAQPDPRTVINPNVLMQEGSGLAPRDAEFMADMFAQYDPGIVEGLQIPQAPITREYADEVGLLSRDGSFPSTFLDYNLRANAGPDLGQVVNRVRQGIPDAPQTVDDNGTVDKYPEGTGPYDAPGITRPGGIAGAKYGTVINGRAAKIGRARVSGIGATSEGSGSNVAYAFGAIGVAAMAVLGLSLIAAGAKGR
jgi:hypothetical protein